MTNREQADNPNDEGFDPIFVKEVLNHVGRLCRPAVRQRSRAPVFYEMRDGGQLAVRPPEYLYRRFSTYSGWERWKYLHIGAGAVRGSLVHHAAIIPQDARAASRGFTLCGDPLKVTAAYINSFYLPDPEGYFSSELPEPQMEEDFASILQVTPHDRIAGLDMADPDIMAFLESGNASGL
jgi:hypothetical protein